MENPFELAAALASSTLMPLRLGTIDLPVAIVRVTCCSGVSDVPAAGLTESTVPALAVFGSVFGSSSVTLIWVSENPASLRALTASDLDIPTVFWGIVSFFGPSLTVIVTSLPSGTF